MSAWLVGLMCGVAFFIAATVNNIFKEVRSIRRMMNQDRGIPPD